MLPGRHPPEWPTRRRIVPLAKLQPQPGPLIVAARVGPAGGAAAFSDLGLEVQDSARSHQAALLMLAALEILRIIQLPVPKGL